MPILVKLDDLSGENQWAIIELQGDLECRNGTTLLSQFIGDLYFKTQDDGSVLPIVTIGHHILNGKIQNLEKPLAVMEREKIDGEDVEFKVKAVVTKKITFKTRPKPIISTH